MLKFSMVGNYAFERGPLKLCDKELREFVALPDGCNAIWIELNARPARHRLEVRMFNITEWWKSRQGWCPCSVDGHQVQLCPDTREYLLRRFGFKTFYLTVWY